MKALYFFLLLFFQLWLIQTQSITFLTPLKKVENSYSESTTFYFATNITDLFYDVESAITFYIDEDISSITVWSKLVQEEDPDKLIEKMPESEGDSEFVLTESEFKNYYHLFFKQFYFGSTFLVVKMTIKPSVSTNKRMTAILSKPIEIQSFFSAHFERNFMLNDYVPVFYKYLLEKKEDQGFSYVFSCFNRVPSKNDPIMTIFVGGITANSNGKIVMNENSDRNVIYAYTLPWSTGQGMGYAMTFKFFGPAQQVSFMMDNVEAQFSSVITDERPNGQIYSLEVPNAYQTYHYLGFYKQDANDAIYIEKLSGDFKVYFEDYVSTGAKKYTDILPMKDNGVGREITNYFIVPETKTDLITIQCETACSFNLHFIDEKHLTLTEATIGEMFYKILKSGVSQNVIVNNLEPNTYIEVYSPGHQDGLVTINDNEFSSLTKDDPIARESLSSSGSDTIKFSTKLSEDVFLVIKVTSGNTYPNMITEEVVNKDMSKYELIKFPKSKDYASISINLIQNVSISQYGMSYYVGKGQKNFIHIPIRTTISPFRSYGISFTNPYLNKLTLPSESDMYYIALALNDGTATPSIKMNVTFTSKNGYDSLQSEVTHKIEGAKTYYIGQADKEDKKLFMVVTKCKAPEVDIYLKYQGIELSRTFIEKQFAKIIIDPKNYDYDLEFRKGNIYDKFSPLMFYYKYATQDEIDQFSLTSNFAITYEFSVSQNNTIFIKWHSPFTTDKSISVKYYVYMTKMIDSTTEFNICDADEDKSVYRITSAQKELTHGLKIDRNNDNYIYITAEPQTGLAPKFTYNVLSIPKYDTIKPIQQLETIVRKYRTDASFYFSVNLTDYAFRDENLITFKLEDKLENVKILSKVVQITNQEDDNDDLFELLPATEEDNQFLINKSNYDNFYHLFFTQIYGEGYRSYLLINVTVTNAEAKEKDFTLVLSKKPVPESLFGTSQEMTITINEYIPVLKIFYVNKREDRGYSYVFSSFSGIMTAFVGTFTSFNSSGIFMNPNSDRTIIYAHNLPFTATEETFGLVSLMFFGPAQKIIFGVDNSEAQFSTIIDEKRPTDQIYTVEVPNGYQPFYFIGLYQQASDDIIYIEKVSGDFDAFYNDNIPASTTNYLDILPNEKIGSDIRGNFVNAYTNIDLITIQCFTKCIFNIHFINYETMKSRTTASIGEMFYQLIWKESKNEIDVYNLEEDIRMEILDVNKKNANVLINGQETIALSQDNSLVRKELNMVGDCNLQFSTNSLEFVLLVIKFVKDNTFGEIKGETSQIYEFTNQYILFKLPQNKDYLSYTIQFEQEPEESQTTLKAYFGKGKAEYAHIPSQVVSEPLFFYSEASFMNPYINELDITNNTDYYYYVIHLEPESSTSSIKVKANVTITPRNRDSKLIASETTKIGGAKTYYLGQTDSEDKQLFMAITKCQDVEVDLYLKYHNIEMYRHFIEKSFTQLIVDPKNYDYDIEFRKGDGENFSPLMFYYQYATQEEIEKFSLNGDFAISYKFSTTSNNTVFLSWKSPFTSRAGTIEVSYHVFKTEVVDNTTTYNICDCDEDNAISKVTTKENQIRLGIAINREKDNYVYITAEPKTGIRPKFTYHVIQIPQTFFPNEPSTPITPETRSIVGWVIAIIILILLVLGLGWLYCRQRKKANIILNEAIQYRPIVPLNSTESSNI